MEKILIFESDWRKAPGNPPSQSYQASALYRSAFQNTDITVRCRVLQAGSLLNECQDFLRLPENQRGPNLILLSTHGEYLSNGQRALSAIDRVILLETLLQRLQAKLSRSILILDVCHVGQTLAPLCQQFGLLGVLGFQARVNWVASSALLLSVLRHYLGAHVLHMQRASSRRPARILAQMQTGHYATLMRQLAVQAAWKHELNKQQ